ncbi:GTPase family protein [Thiorhodococcus fuscus]|uniref:GTPase family protein n=1 Tax=Thiorhodococcus fuscus TaxID=527200 RepID=A0ABW4Y4N7_9GAMM
MTIFHRKTGMTPWRRLREGLPDLGRSQARAILECLLEGVERHGSVPLVLWAMPVVVLLPLGVLWLLEGGWFLVWIGVLAMFAGLGVWLQSWIASQIRRPAQRGRPDSAEPRLQAPEPIQQAEILSPAPPTSPPQTSVTTETRPVAEGSLRILLLGCSNSGKSTLIGALFGKLRVATDLTPDPNRALTPYRLEHQGRELAIIYDTPGSERLAHKSLHEVANVADFIIWVSAAHRPERQSERQILDALRLAQTARVDRRPPPLLLVVTHIDRLRPLREWQPPYDLTNPDDLKAMSIQAAVTAFSADFEVPIASVVPVCLAEGRVYNVDDTLWAAMLDLMDRDQRTRLLRCLDAGRREENWTLLRRQLANAGRLLLAFPGRAPRRL